VPAAIQFGDKNIITASAGEVERAPARVKIGGTLEDAGGVDVNRPIHSHASAQVIACPAPPHSPGEGSAAIQFGDKDIITARAGEVERAPARIQIGGTLEEAGGVDIPRPI